MKQNKARKLSLKKTTIKKLSGFQFGVYQGGGTVSCDGCTEPTLPILVCTSQPGMSLQSMCIGATNTCCGCTR